MAPQLPTMRPCMRAMIYVAISAAGAMAGRTVEIDFDMNADVHESVTLIQLSKINVTEIKDGAGDQQASDLEAFTPCNASMVCGMNGNEWCTVYGLNHNLTLCQEFVDCGDLNKDGLLGRDEYYLSGKTDDEKDAVLTCSCSVMVTGFYQENVKGLESVGGLACADTNGDGELSLAEVRPALEHQVCVGVDTAPYEEWAAEPAVCDPAMNKSYCLSPPFGCTEKYYSAGYKAGYTAGYEAGYEAGATASTSLLAANATARSGDATGDESYKSGYTTGYQAGSSRPWFSSHRRQVALHHREMTSHGVESAI